MFKLTVFLKIWLIVLQNLTKLNFSLLQLTNLITITYDTVKMVKIVVSSAGPQIRSKSNFLPYQKKGLVYFRVTVLVSYLFSLIWCFLLCPSTSFSATFAGIFHQRRRPKNVPSLSGKIFCTRTSASLVFSS